MKLKLFFTLILAAALCFYGCTKTEIEELVIPDTPTDVTEPEEPDDNPDDVTDEDEDDEFFSEPGDGTRESPYTVSQALELINNGENKAHKCCYVKGFVAKYNILTAAGLISYYVTDHSLGDDNYEKEDCLYVRNGQGLGGEEVEDRGYWTDYLSEGDKIVVYGRLEVVGSNEQCITESQIYYLNGVTADVEEDEYDDYYGFDPMEGVYYNNFDSVPVNDIYVHPLMEYSEYWKNEMGTGADRVDYNYSGDTYIEYSSSFGSSGSGTSNYDGSGTNCIRLAYRSGEIYVLKNYFVIKNISLPAGVTDYTLYFGLSRDSSRGVFSHDDFNVYVSDDGNRWSELSYEFPKGDPETSTWDLASATFSLPAQTSCLYIYFTTNVAAGYCIDDVCLMASDTHGVSVNFSTGVELPGYTGYEGDGTMENPYKVSQAVDLVNSGSYDPDTIYFVKGVVTSEIIHSRYNISESGYYRDEPILYVYGIDGLGVSSKDEVAVYGKFSVSDDGTPQISDGGLYSQNDDVSEGFDEDICQYMTDSDFISYCINNFDTNKNGRISFAEAEEVTTISCSTATDFTGIEYFPNLQSFTSTSVKYVDLSDNAELTTVKMNGSPIEQLDLSNNIKVTTLGANAFDKCSSLTSITLPESLTGIGNYAFRNCSSLTAITLPDGLSTIGNYGFQNCTSLVSVYVPGSLASWGTLPFDGCGALATVTLGDGLTSICEKAFYNCTALKSVTIPSSLTKWGDYAFASTGLTSVDLPEGMTTIGKYAFYNCTALTSATIPSSVSEWGSYAFSECTSLKTLTLGDGLTAIGECAFYGCKSLNTVTIPYTITECGDYAFAYSGLTTITLPEGMTTIGKYAFYNCTSLTSATIPSSVSEWGSYAFEYAGLISVDLAEGLLSIGDYAFRYCKSLTSVYIPGSLEVWGTRPFNFCSALTTVIFGDGLKAIGDSAFRECPLTSVDLPEGLTTIGEYAFYKCTGLKSVTIPSSVTAWGDYAFYECTKLNSLTLADGLTTIGGYAFAYCRGLETVAIPTSMTEWGGYAFCGSGLTSITLPEGLTTIGDWAFTCGNLKTVTIPNTVTEWGTYAFAESGLSSVTLSEGLTTIGDWAFYWCNDLTSITLPETLKTIGAHAFAMKPNTSTYADESGGGLYSITIPDSVTEIGEYAFYGSLYLRSAYLPKNLTTLSKGIFDHCTHLTTVILPENLTTIGDSAFIGCWNLPSVTFPESLTTIEYGAFCECTSMESFTLPENLTTIGSLAFGSCTSLKSVSLPKNLTTIGERAFTSCTSLASVTSEPTAPPAVGSSAFNNINTSTLYVPSGSEDAYADSDWADYFDNFLPIK